MIHASGRQEDTRLTSTGVGTWLRGSEDLFKCLIGDWGGGGGNNEHSVFLCVCLKGFFFFSP